MGRRPADEDGLLAMGVPLPPLVGLSPPTIETYLRASAGPPRFAARLREIEQLTAQHAERLRRTYRALAVRYGAGSDLAEAAWRRWVRECDFADVNALIDQHNRYYPIERSLAMDPATGDFVPVAGRCYRRRPLDAAWALGAVGPTASLSPRQREGII
jgi:hypothetical protein